LTFGGDQVFPHLGGVEVAGDAKGPAERGTPLRQIKASLVGMQMSTSARRPSTRIRNENALDRYDA
jgi:hypothetical protein